MEALGITKSYNGVPALRNVDFSVRAGEVHALLGENGAGKSTLIKILSGVTLPDGGKLRLGGHSLRLRTPLDALSSGIATVHQELSLVPHLSAAQNMWLGHEPGRRLGLINFRSVRQAAAEICQRYGVSLNLDAWIGDLPLAEQQVVEILKALAWNPQVLILDEPTSALTAQYADWLLGLLRSLAQAGVAIVFISHRLAEVMEVADRITVLKDGSLIGSVLRSEVHEGDLVRMMVGRELKDIFPAKADPRQIDSAPVILRAVGLRSGRALRDVSFELRRGEIMGIAGLEGQGQHELMLALFGTLPLDSGDLFLAGDQIAVHNPRQAIRHKIALVPVDRRTEGLVMPLSVQQNLSLPTLRERSRWGLVQGEKEKHDMVGMASNLAIRARGLGAPVRTLSGGNQQKVVLGKWLLLHPSVLLLDDPTRGVDVETRRELYHRIRSLAEQGTAVLVRSTDTMELVGLCDSVLVMYEGAVVTRLTGEQITEANIVASAVGAFSKGMALNAQ
ncbi:MAG: sugar ABC transporter ATP-binding protein [Firmicutes bacterium]|nr:sugar ABC transporter ATP-binding protein [Bacillota bacterium]